MQHCCNKISGRKTPFVILFFSLRCFHFVRRQDHLQRLLQEVLKKNEVIHVKIAVRRYIIFRDIAFILIAQSLRHCSYIKGEFINLVDF